MSLASLRYDENRTSEETRQGVYIYAGDPSEFHVWEFRTRMRMKSTKTEDIKKSVNSIVEALRGSAAQVAMDIGDDELLKRTDGRSS